MAHSPTDDDPELQIPSGIDTGAMLTAYVKEKRIYQGALGRALGRSYPSVRDYRQRKSLQTSVLWAISVALKHNFFADIAAQLPAAYTTTAPGNAAKNARIAELEQALQLAEAERDVLKKVLTHRA